MRKILFTVLLLPFSVVAQVTIGSALKPNEGALLDLKEEKSTNTVTASKGLLLPRVELTAIDKLSPMFSYDAGDTPTSNDLLEHIGLIVYNINSTEQNNTICSTGVISGLYVWDGAEWTPLHEDGGIHPNREKDVSTLIDKRDPENIITYRMAKFGKAGWWMIENLRADRMPDGSRITRRTTTINDGGNFQAYYNYPHPNSSFEYSPIPISAATDKLVRDNPEYGYMYSWLAATNSKELQNDTDGSATVQGICPDGWHLPSIDEWRELSEELNRNTCDYATEPMLDNISNRALTATSAELLDGTSHDDFPTGTSHSHEDGGFNLHTLGICTAAGYYYYGISTRMWTANSLKNENNGTAMSLGFNMLEAAAGNPTGRFIDDNANALLPVRCKRDD